LAARLSSDVARHGINAAEREYGGMMIPLSLPGRRNDIEAIRMLSTPLKSWRFPTTVQKAAISRS